MQKLEDVATPMNKNEIRYLVGNEIMEIQPLSIYSEIVCDFLDELSGILRKNSEAKLYPDVLTFAFWCRKANILKLKEADQRNYPRFGRGMVFHIAPSNVPINFAFSLVFGMLAGNANVVRVSGKDFPQTMIVCSAINHLLELERFDVLKRQIQIISYDHKKEVTDYFSQKCSVRVIWGGDRTIEEIRRSPLHPRANEVTFSDRYSFAIFDEKVFADMGDAINQIAEKFYNDTYLMDQNACSSPHLILWKNSLKDCSGRKLFWKALAGVANKYDLQAKKVMDKYTMLCEQVANTKEIVSVDAYNNLLYVAKLEQIPAEFEDLRGRFGLFYEADLMNFYEVLSKVTNRVQTCVTYGIDHEELLKELIENHVVGIDRIVTVGEAMNIGVYWDGYDVIGNLSRQIVTS